MRQTVPLSRGVPELFGTFDENLKLLESSLGVTTQYRDSEIVIEGEAAQVHRAAHIFEDYNRLLSEGRNLTNVQVKDLIQLASRAPADFRSRSGFRRPLARFRQEADFSAEPQPAALHGNAGIA